MMGTLVEELAAALERMVDATCPSMRALWLSATVRERRDLRGGETAIPSVPLPDAFASWKKSKRSKYEALAMFRHAVVWRLSEADWRPPSPAGRVYFTPCRDVAPFRAGGADARSNRGLEELERVRRQLVTLIDALRKSQESARSSSLNEMHIEGALVERATRRSLRDVLKLDQPRFDGIFPTAEEPTS